MLGSSQRSREHSGADCLVRGWARDRAVIPHRRPAQGGLVRAYPNAPIATCAPRCPRTPAPCRGRNAAWTLRAPGASLIKGASLCCLCGMCSAQGSACPAHRLLPVRVGSLLPSVLEMVGGLGLRSLAKDRFGLVSFAHHGILPFRPAMGKPHRVIPPVFSVSLYANAWRAELLLAEMCFTLVASCPPQARGLHRVTRVSGVV